MQDQPPVERLIIIVVAYTPAEYEKIFTISEDRDEVSMSWEEWRRAADEKKADAVAQDAEYVEQYIDALGLVTYCLARGIPINARTRGDYAHVLYERWRSASMIPSDNPEEDAHPITDSYAPPLDRLLIYTNIKGDDPLPNISYVETFGLGPEHVPDLIRMATDDYLNGEDSNEFEFAAPLHAVRALAELHAEAAIETLLSLYDKASQSENEWMLETLIDVYTTIGPVALPALEQFLADPSHDDSAKNCVTEIIDHIAKKYPETRTECIGVVTRRLADFEMNDPELNSFLIADLIHMKALEAAPLIEEAYANDCVDEAWCGDWNDVQYSLGLKERPPRQERSGIFPLLSTPTPTPVLATPSNPDLSVVHKSNKKSPSSKKAKSKMAKASKKANRRKK